MTLSTEIAAARPEDQREVLERLWGRINPRSTSPSDIEDHVKRAWQFIAMLDCGAFLSAAEMLVPPNAGIHKWVYPEHASVAIFMDEDGETTFRGAGKTEALALAAAIAKSLEGREDR